MAAATVGAGEQIAQRVGVQRRVSFTFQRIGHVPRAFVLLDQLIDTIPRYTFTLTASRSSTRSSSAGMATISAPPGAMTRVASAGLRRPR